MSDTPPVVGQVSWGADLNAYLGSLETRIATLEGGIVIVPGDGTLEVNNSVHAHTAGEPTLTIIPFEPMEFDLVPANATHAHTAAEVVLLPEGPVELTVQTGAPTVTPWVQLQSGSTATISWYNSADTLITTGGKPTITRPSDGIVRMLVTASGLPAMNEVDSFNLGFDSEQDPGIDNIGPTYNHPGQPVTDIAGLQLLTGLRYFMAANSPLASILNCTGMTNIEFIECFSARIPTLTMTGCTSLIRVCVESCAIETLDLSTIKDNLKDLRCAANTGPGVNLISDGPLSVLWHYCVRGQYVIQHIPHTQLPVVEQYWPFNTDVISTGPPISPVMISCDHRGNRLTTPTTDSYMTTLAAFTRSGGFLRMPEAQPPTSATDAARATLLSRGWEVDVPLATYDGTFDDTPTHGPFVAADLTTFSMATIVSGGVLYINSFSYGRCIFRPGSRSAGDVYFEVAVDRNQVDHESYWAMMVNCDASGNGGLRVMIHWGSRNPATAAGVSFDASNGPDADSTHIVWRAADDPPGWTASGLHKVGLYHAAHQTYIMLDGVKVYRASAAWVDSLGAAGGYVGVGGWTDGTDRMFQSWGLSDVTGAY